MGLLFYPSAFSLYYDAALQINVCRKGISVQDIKSFNALYQSTADLFGSDVEFAVRSLSFSLVGNTIGRAAFFVCV